MTEQQYIRGIREGKMRVFERFYDEYKHQFVAFMMGAQSVDTKEHAEDLYRMACAIVHNNIRAGKCTEENLAKGSLKTYLNTIGKQTLWSERRKRSLPFVFGFDALLKADQMDELVTEDDPTNEQLAIIRKTVELMPLPCSRLLTLKIYEEKKPKEIALMMGYSNERSVISQVHKCREKLIVVVRERLKKYGYGC